MVVPWSLPVRSPGAAVQAVGGAGASEGRAGAAGGAPRRDASLNGHVTLYDLADGALALPEYDVVTGG